MIENRHTSHTINLEQQRVATIFLHKETFGNINRHSNSQQPTANPVILIPKIAATASRHMTSGEEIMCGLLLYLPYDYRPSNI